WVGALQNATRLCRHRSSAEVLGRLNSPRRYSPSLGKALLALEPPWKPPAFSLAPWDQGSAPTLALSQWIAHHPAALRPSQSIQSHSARGGESPRSPNSCENALP